MNILFNWQRIMAWAEKYYLEMNRTDPGKQVRDYNTGK